MSKNSLLSAQGSFLVGVDVDKANEVTVVDLVRAKKAIAGVIQAPDVDMNSDGVVNDTDVRIIKDRLLGKKG